MNLLNEISDKLRLKSGKTKLPDKKKKKKKKKKEKGETNLARKDPYASQPSARRSALLKTRGKKAEGDLRSRSSKKQDQQESDLSEEASGGEADTTWVCALYDYKAEDDAKMMECELCSLYFCCKCFSMHDQVYEYMTRDDALWPKPARWIDRSIPIKVRQTDRQYNKYMSTRSEEDYNSYHRIQNQVRWNTRKAKSNYEKNFAHGAKINIKSVFSVFTEEQTLAPHNEHRTLDSSTIADLLWLSSPSLEDHLISETQKTLILLYKSLIGPHLEYCNAITLPKTIRAMKAIERIQRESKKNPKLLSSTRTYRTVPCWSTAFKCEKIDSRASFWISIGGAISLKNADLL
ncbi:hypothetical protein CAPTEDRAFT_192190 [Capitella teleta]|uniref:Uncharacterized protein n=1 Tax=Capitella teleta TaxID=283909 RepID=R7TN15_CAPTE|nr:hypothetical protein CAPTEDRAFT_192190 [Capitella teleta]|eukprot:ELT94912.1 hypothetical protein CAPTEDRAFT_192190 [Capitella teleta]